MSSDASPIESMVGQTVGSYRITEKVSLGGMGTVYKAEHLLIGKLAAVKVLHPELRANREVVNRFFNEAKATTQIKHPGIVEVFDFGYLPSGDGFLVMEFLEGMSLAKRLTTRGKMNEGEAAMVMRGVCSALGAAHAKQIVHRDLKPDNIFLVPDPDAGLGERPKLLDFGIAKLTDTNLAGSGSATKTGSVMGTPTYMAPEQCKGAGVVDLRADLYSLGCIYYELLCGRPPFIEEGAGELIGAHLFVEPDLPSLHEPSVSPESEKLIMALLQKDPAHRPQTARELGQRFSGIAQRQGWITNTSPSGVTEKSLPELGKPVQPLRTPVVEASAPTVAALSDVAIKARPVLATAPTTLSGAASQSIHELRRSRRGRWIAGIGALATAATVIIVVMMAGGDHVTKPAGEPNPPARSTGVAVPTPSSQQPPSVAPPPPTPTAPTPPAIAKPVVTPMTTPHKRPTAVTAKPHPKDPTKPVGVPVKPTTGSGSGMLIERDL